MSDDSFCFQDECVNMISRLFHAPLYEGEDAVGAATVGSSEAFMLAGEKAKDRECIVQFLVAPYAIV